jgi:hypothetical protein
VRGDVLGDLGHRSGVFHLRMTMGPISAGVNCIPWRAKVREFSGGVAVLSEPIADVHFAVSDRHEEILMHSARTLLPISKAAALGYAYPVSVPVAVSGIQRDWNYGNPVGKCEQRPAQAFACAGSLALSVSRAPSSHEAVIEVDHGICETILACHRLKVVGTSGWSSVRASFPKFPLEDLVPRPSIVGVDRPGVPSQQWPLRGSRQGSNCRRSVLPGSVSVEASPRRPPRQQRVRRPNLEVL